MDNVKILTFVFGEKNIEFIRNAIVMVLFYLSQQKSLKILTIITSNSQDWSGFVGNTKSIDFLSGFICNY